MNNRQQTRLEMYTFGKHVRISTYIFISAYIIMIIWGAIGAGLQSWEYPIELRIVCLLVIIVGMLIGTVYIAQLIEYDFLGSKVIISKDGVRHQSRVAELFIPWEKIQRIQVQEWCVVIKGVPTVKYYIVFYTDYRAQKKQQLDVKHISNEFIFVLYDREIVDFLDKQSGWSVINTYKRLGKYQKKWERKQRRLWRRLLKEADMIERDSYEARNNDS